PPGRGLVRLCPARTPPLTAGLLRVAAARACDAIRELGMIEAEWWDYDSVDEMADAVAGDIGFIIESALDARGEALIALPGGKTPLPIFAKLASAKLNWKKVT